MSDALLTGGEDGKLEHWDTVSGKDLGTVGRLEKPIYRAIVFRDGKLALAALPDGVRIFDLKRRAEPVTLEEADVHGIALSADSERALTASWNRRLALWDLESGKVRIEWKDPADVPHMPFFLPGDRAVVSTERGKIVVWDLASGKTIEGVHGAAPVYGLAVSADGTRLVSGDIRGVVAVWQLDGMSFEKVGLFETQTDGVSWVALSRDGKRAVGKHPPKIACVVLSPDEQTCFTSGFDGFVRRWELR